MGLVTLVWGFQSLPPNWIDNPFTLETALGPPLLFVSGTTDNVQPVGGRATATKKCSRLALACTSWRPLRRSRARCKQHTWLWIDNNINVENKKVDRPKPTFLFSLFPYVLHNVHVRRLHKTLVMTPNNSAEAASCLSVDPKRPEAGWRCWQHRRTERCSRA